MVVDNHFFVGDSDLHVSNSFFSSLHSVTILSSKLDRNVQYFGICTDAVGNSQQYSLVRFLREMPPFRIKLWRRQNPEVAKLLLTYCKSIPTHPRTNYVLYYCNHGAPAVHRDYVPKERTSVGTSLG